MRGEPRAREEFLERVAAERAIEVLLGTRVTRVMGDERLRTVRLAGADSDGEYDRSFGGMVIKVGSVPNTEWCRATLEHDAEGHLIVDQEQRTSTPQIWAAGDVTRPALYAVTVAYGAGALAVASIRSALRMR